MTCCLHISVESPITANMTLRIFLLAALLTLSVAAEEDVEVTDRKVHSAVIESCGG